MQGNAQGDPQKKDSVGNEIKPKSNLNVQQKNSQEKNDTDTAPDEFIAPNADTDLPLDGEGIMNDAVLGGEDHVTDKPENRQQEKKQ